MAFFYYYLPINNAVSNVPNEGIVIYQTALILLGAFITYKALFTPKKTIDNLQNLSQQIKESEIACLKSMIKSKTVTKDHQDVTVTVMRDKIVHLQEEITLMHISNKIKCLTDGPNDPDDQTHPIKIARLKQQQSRILAHLMSEVHRLKKETNSEKDESSIKQDTSHQTNTKCGQQDQQDQQQNIVKYKKEEVYRLQCEILHHMLSKRAHLKDESDDHQQLKTLELIISTSLHKDIRNYLESLQKLAEQQQDKDDLEMKIVDILYTQDAIDDEIRHLGEICDFNRKKAVHDTMQVVNVHVRVVNNRRSRGHDQHNRKPDRYPLVPCTDQETGHESSDENAIASDSKV
jgi:hypothetical protein